MCLENTWKCFSALRQGNIFQTFGGTKLSKSVPSRLLCPGACKWKCHDNHPESLWAEETRDEMLNYQEKECLHVCDSGIDRKSKLKVVTSSRKQRMWWVYFADFKGASKKDPYTYKQPYTMCFLWDVHWCTYSTYTNNLPLTCTHSLYTFTVSKS